MTDATKTPETATQPELVATKPAQDATPAPARGTGRPAKGYTNAAGKRVPGVTTILGRFKESGGLVQWAYQCGLDGKDINDVRDAAADAGKCAHEMIDAHLHGHQFDKNLWPGDALKNAEHAFLAFLEWQEQSKLNLQVSEVPLVSEKYQFGGTFDAGYVAGNLRLLDYKTSSGIYLDHVLQVAGGYSLLWQEHHPKQPLYGMDILRISKPEDNASPVTFEHRHWSAEIFPMAQRQFILLREAYEWDKKLKKLL